MKVAVIGAGLGGLSAAYYLKRAGLEVIVLEAEELVGGLSGVIKLTNGDTIPKFHTFISSGDREMWEFLRNVDCEGLFQESIDSRIFFASADPKREILTQRYESLALLKQALEQIPDWHSLESTYAIEWLRTIVSVDHIHEYWIPRLVGRFGEKWRDISAAWVWNEVMRPPFVSDEKRFWPIPGWGAIIERIQSRCEALGVTFQRVCRVSTVRRRDEVGWMVGNSENLVEADAVLFTVPVPLMAKMLRGQIDRAIQWHLDRIEYVGNRCLIMETDSDLGVCWRPSPFKAGSPMFIGVVQWRFGKARRLYMSRYVLDGHELSRESDQRFIERSLEWFHTNVSVPIELKGIATWRSENSQHVFGLNFSRGIPPYKLDANGLWCATMVHSYPAQRSKGSAVGIGRKVAEMIIASS